MTRNRTGRDLVEIFGYAPDDLTPHVRTLWKLGGCPFLGKQCTKENHDQSIIYGTCSVTSPTGDTIICPNRLYADKYQVLRKIVADCYGKNLPLFMFAEYVQKRAARGKVAVALGLNSGREVKLAKSFSMDWVIAIIEDGKLQDYIGVEVQSIDIKGNYRDAWHGYKNITAESQSVPSSGHGLNWANVHKRLIPQIIRKGLVYSRSSLVSKGLYFIVPEIVYQKFEDVVGSDLPAATKPRKDTITVHTYGLGPEVAAWKQRALQLIREVRFGLGDFADRFISGPNLPSGQELDNAVLSVLGIDRQHEKGQK